uniref:Dual specificity protein kinase TTK n=1 Tax=Scleropages formosus TaxID=113540 RepID=A0A8C9RKK9_SCLFO
MEEDEHTDRQMQFALLCQKLKNIKTTYLSEDNVNHILSSNSPETCLTYLKNLEKRGDPQTDSSLLTKLIDCYTRVFSCLPLVKHSQNESYARMLVRFAELKAIQEPDDAQDNFTVARSNSKCFAFVHIAHAQFELSQGNPNKSALIIQRAFAVNAKPTELLETALQNLKLGKTQLLPPEDKENFASNLSLFLTSGCFPQPSVISPEQLPWEDIGPVDSTTTLLRRPEKKAPPRPEDTTGSISQILSSNSPETCLAYLTNLEKRGDPQMDSRLLTKLIDCYAQVFSCLPLAKHSQNESYARMLVRFAELKAVQDPDDAQDRFILARSSCKCFAFVHIAHAQFELSQGNASKCALILQKAFGANAKPTELVETALQNLKLGKTHLLPLEDRKNIAGQSCLRAEQPEFTVLLLEYSYVTPVQRNPPTRASASVPHGAGQSQLPCTPVNQVSYPQQGSVAAFSNDSITIKGRQFFILKMIGRGGSSKVYQVLDHRKQLFAVKYVNLEEADSQTIESYKNEIEHLNHLQQYSDQIIKLYDYEITNSYIYMLMECGNLDLNTWLRNHKGVNPLERKFYWKNMLEAVHTIHKHGIVHSDLKPANFVIVNASLKLIDFGIANRIQPDVTSIVKDSQVGTLNYMPPEAIKDTSSKAGKPSSKISPKGDVWSLGCILYCMTYGKTPFQSITNQIAKLHAITDPSHQIDFPDIPEKDLLDVLKRCLVRNPKERISIAELLAHPYLQLQPHTVPEPVQPVNNELQRILNDLAALQSPNSIARAASNLAKMCNSGKRLDVSECLKSSSQASGNM